MEIKIFPTNKQWSIIEADQISVYFIGYIDFKGDLILKADDLSKQVRHKLNSPEIISFLEMEFLPYCNGNFSFIIKFGNKVIAITDYTRNYPIYFRKEKNVLLISDVVDNEMIEGCTINELNCEEFILSGLVLGNDTVFNQVKSLQPAEMLYYDEEYHFKRYFNLHVDPLRKAMNFEEDLIYFNMDELFLRIFKRMIKSCPDVRKWVVPLSGGHDSRLIINYLHRLDCKNVVCFTYGNKDSEEVSISRQAAEAMGYEWHFINYFSTDWANVHSTGIFDEFIHDSFNGCNLPCAQDLLALKVLIDKQVITEKDVVIPGHTAFTESESNLIMQLESEEDSLGYVFKKYYQLFRSDNDKFFKRRLKQLMISNNQNPKSFPDFFNWQERQVKFIGNSVRAYEFFGLKWRMPFWEKEVIDFWQSINYEDRIERSILFKASQSKLFIPKLLEIPIINKFNKTEKKINQFQRLIPNRIKSVIAKIINWESKNPVGTNQTFKGRGKSISEIIAPISIYPKSINKYFKPFLIRRPYQMNVNGLMAILTLRNEVFITKSK